jgi:hypothetical protein
MKTRLKKYFNNRKGHVGQRYLPLLQKKMGVAKSIPEGNMIPHPTIAKLNYHL